MRQLTLSTGLRLCKVRSDGGVEALLNILDSEEDLCLGDHLHIEMIIHESVSMLPCQVGRH
jgi:hypothetical protein